MGYTFEVNIKFHVLSLTSQLNPFLDGIHLMNYGNVFGKGVSA